MLRPFLDQYGFLRVGGRLNLSSQEISIQNPIILAGKQKLTELLIEKEHLGLLHAGPTLMAASLSQKFHIMGSRRIICAVTRSCVTCRRVAGQPCPLLLGQLPRDRLNPGMLFDKVEVNYAGPIMVKSGPVRRPVITKAYMCVFLSFTAKAVHLEAASELSTATFIACMRRFIARRGKPTTIWSDNGTNFM